MQRTHRGVALDTVFDENGTRRGINRGFPKIDHSGSSARIVLEQNKFSLLKGLNLQSQDCRTVVLTSCVYMFHDFRTVLIPIH